MTGSWLTVAVTLLVACGGARTPAPAPAVAPAPAPIDVPEDKDDARVDARATAHHEAVRIQVQIDDVRRQIDATVQDLASATTDADRRVAQDRLAALQRQQSALQARQLVVWPDAAIHPVVVDWVLSKECIDNPLDAGC